jgi:MIP family channel proteins
VPLRVREFTAEFFGVFCIVFMGSGSIMMSARSGSQSALLAGGVAYAMIIAALVASMSHLSSHFNPAVTVGMVALRRTGIVDGVTKITAQCAGGIVGAWTLSQLFPVTLLRDSRIGGTRLAEEVPFMQGLALEAIATGILMLVILGVVRNALRPGIAGVVVGFAVGALVLCIGPLTGASLNPARSLGPAMVSGIWEAHLVYWFGPTLGALAAALVWMFLLDRGEARA